MKWVAGFATNSALGLPAINAVVVLNDPETGVPIAILDGGADHGRADRRGQRGGAAALRAGGRDGRRASGRRRDHRRRASRAASHLAVLGERAAGRHRPRSFDRHAGARRGARRSWPARPPGIAGCDGARDGPRGGRGARTSSSRRRRSRRRGERQVDDQRLAPRGRDRRSRSTTRRTVAAEVARDAALFLVDHREQFLANRDAGNFDGYPDPARDDRRGHPRGHARARPGRVVVTHLGVGLADLVFADAIVRAATAAGRGTTLPR